MSQILFLTGPAGAGKTTTAEKFAADAKGVWAFISQDHIREFVKAGYVHANVEWTDETQRQWDVSIAICCDIVKRYDEVNINCIVDLFAPPGESIDKWKSYVGNLSYTLIVLLPSVEVAVARNAQRTGTALMKESAIREHHEWFSEWTKFDEGKVIDSSNLSQSEVINRITSILANTSMI